MALLNIEDPHKRLPPTGWAPFALGFRPFFMAAGIYAVLMMGLWLLVLHGSFSPGELPPAIWHGHEMLFGFAVAVIAGFLLTAAQNWTGFSMPSEGSLTALFVLWLGGRLAFLVPGLPTVWIALLDWSFLPVLALVLAIPILKAKQLRNYPFPFMLLVLALANGLVHGDALGWLSDMAQSGLQLAVFAIVMMMTVMGGRVIPSFTEGKLRTHARRWKGVERLVLVASMGALLATLIVPGTFVTVILAAIAAGAHGVRLAGWYTNKLWSVPLLWVLHLGYAWIVVGFILLALSAAGLNAATNSALHAFTTGGIGVLTLGMMARVSLGHTGRMLEPAPLMTLAFTAINLAALTRVSVPLSFSTTYTLGMAVAGLLWMGAFCLFVVFYIPILLRPRVDGKAG